jgi:uncharacterized protein DUF4124
MGAMNRQGWAAALVVATVGVMGASTPLPAAAEIYGWVDSSGSVTYSNLPPPKGAKIIDRIEETPSTPQSQAAAAAAHEAQMQSLNARVQQLEWELRQSAMAPATPPSAPYPAASAPSYGPDCDPGFFDCGVWDGPAYYTIGVPYFPYFRSREGFHNRGGFTRPHPPHSGSPFRGGAPMAVGVSSHRTAMGSAPSSHARR